MQFLRATETLVQIIFIFSYAVFEKFNTLGRKIFKVKDSPYLWSGVNSSPEISSTNEFFMADLDCVDCAFWFFQNFLYHFRSYFSTCCHFKKKITCNITVFNDSIGMTVMVLGGILVQNVSYRRSIVWQIVHPGIKSHTLEFGSF